MSMRYFIPGNNHADAIASECLALCNTNSARDRKEMFSQFGAGINPVINFFAGHNKCMPKSQRIN